MKQHTPTRIPKRRTWMNWVGRLLLFVLPLEFLLSFVSIPPKFEAGVWYGNSYRERLALQTWPLSQDFNNLGYRDMDWMKKTSQKRVAMLGDSRFYGKYVSREQTFSHFVTNNSTWYSMNLGLPGASIFEAKDFILDDALQLEPDVIVMCFDINSSLFSVMTRKQGGSRHDILQNILRSSLIYTWLERFWYVMHQDIQPIMSIEEYSSMLTEVIQISKDHHTDVILVIGWAFLEDFPDLYNRERYEKFQDVSRQIGMQQGIHILDMNELLQSKDLNQYLIGMEQMHLSEKGHQYIGQILIDLLMEHYNE